MADTPFIDPTDDRYVVFPEEGKRFLRVRGGDGTEAPDGDQDTPAGDATPPGSDGSDTGADGQDGSNFEQRYNDLRPEFDRKSQELAELDEKLRNPEMLRELLAEKYGYQFEDGEGDDDQGVGDDDLIDPEDRIDRLEQTFAQQQEMQQAQQRIEAEDTAISNAIDAIAEAEKEEFSPEEIQVLGDLALAMRDERGRPNVKGAYERLFGTVLTARQSKWIESKKTSRRPGGGPAATDNSIDLNATPQQRRDFMRRRLQEQSEQV